MAVHDTLGASQKWWGILPAFNPFFIFFITALLGRVWCGWGCPQTVYMEFLFRPLERLLEGGWRGAQRLDERGFWAPRRVVKHAVYAVVAVVLAHVFLAYFVGVEELSRWMTRSPIEHPTSFLVMLVTTALILSDFGWFREQTCLVACPYGRLQSALLDRRSLIVGYDPLRGESRVKGVRDRPAGAGDCIDCLPLRGKERALGTICLHSERRSGFAPEKVDLLTVFADQAALAIENARLYQEVRLSLETKSTLLQEVHHRVRNNLQAVASLLNMQMRRVQEPRVVRLLEESASRIQSIAAVHDLLCQETLGVTTVQAVTRQVLEVANAQQGRPGLDLRYQVVEESPLPVGSKKATLLALLVNELFSNAISHGFAGRKRGTVVVDTYLGDGNVVVQVKDDGQGPEEDANNEEGGLGLQIVRALVTRDLGGAFPCGETATGRWPPAAPW